MGFKNLIIAMGALLTLAVAGTPVVCAGEHALRIMPVGDSITAGYTDNPGWKQPFEFGYRGPLSTLLTEAGIKFQFVGASAEPFNKLFGDPTHGGTVKPQLELRDLKQDGHRGYGGIKIGPVLQDIDTWIKQDRPDLILLMIGINGISAGSPAQLDSLMGKIFQADKHVMVVVAQITPYFPFKQTIVDYNRYIRETLAPSYSKRGFKIVTVDQYSQFLVDPKDAKSIDRKRLSNGTNHPSNEMYAKMALIWLDGIRTLTQAATAN